MFELRDYFAAAALPAVMDGVSEMTHSGDVGRYARLAYAVADAMLAAREGAARG